MGVEKGREKRLALFYKGDLSLNRSLSGGEKCTAIGPLYGEGDSLAGCGEQQYCPLPLFRVFQR